MVVEFLVALIGLGVAIDYALLIVMRWREEHAAGRPNREAVVEAMDHAGRAVITSGIAVAIGLLALVVLPVPFLRSIGYAGMLIPLVSVLVAITMLPVVLDTIGPRLDRIGVKRRTASNGQGWVPWGRLVVRRRWVIGGIALAILAVFLIPVASFSTGTPARGRAGLERPGQAGLDDLQRLGHLRGRADAVRGGRREREPRSHGDAPRAGSRA